MVVPTRNSSRTVAACLASVRAQTYSDVELVVVDNHSTDATRALAERFADRVIVEGPERSNQRNLGASASTGEFLLFVDSDMVLSTRVVEEVVDAFVTSPHMRALVIPERSVGEGFWARCRALEKELYVGDPNVEAARAFRRSAFVEVGGFDERLVGVEDWDVAERVAKAPENLGRVAASIVHDEGRLRLRQDLGKKVYYGRTAYIYAREHPNRIAGRILRMSFLRGWRLLARKPVLTAGLMALRTLETGAVLAGAASSVLGNKPAKA